MKSNLKDMVKSNHANTLCEKCEKHFAISSMFKKILFGAGCILTFHSACGEESAPNIASRFSGRPIAEQTMANLPKGREQEVIDSFVADCDTSVLLRINHAPTVERVIKKYSESEGKDSGGIRRITDSGSPYLVEKLVPILYRENQYTTRNWGGGGHVYSDEGQSAAAAKLIGHLLLSAPEFSPEVKDWAKKYIRPHSQIYIALTRLFWEENQEALKAHQFDKVVVPQGSSAMVQAYLSQRENSAPNTNDVTNLIVPKEHPPQPAEHPPQPAGEENSSPLAILVHYWWIAGLLIAGTIGFLIRKKRYLK